MNSSEINLPPANLSASPDPKSSIPSVLRFNNIDAVTSALSQFPSSEPIIKYHNPNDDVPIITTDQYHPNSNRHFIRRDSLPQYNNKNMSLNGKNRTEERYIQDWGNAPTCQPSAGQEDPKLNWTRPNTQGATSGRLNK